MPKRPSPGLFRTYELMNPYAGEYSIPYMNFLTRRVTLFGDIEALLCLRENVWLIEGMLELHRHWESDQHRRALVAKMTELGIPFIDKENGSIAHKHNSVKLPRKITRI